MRSLQAAGIGWRPPFVKAETIDDRPFEILRAESRPSQFRQGEHDIVIQARLLGYPGVEPVYDDNGDSIALFSWSAALVGQRVDIVRAFELDPRETLGPVQFQWIDTRNGTTNAFVSIEDYAGEIPARRTIAPPARSVAAGMRTPAPSRGPAPNAARPAVAARSAAGRVTAGPSARSTRPPEPPPVWSDDDEPEDLPF